MGASYKPTVNWVRPLGAPVSETGNCARIEAAVGWAVPVCAQGGGPGITRRCRAAARGGMMAGTIAAKDRPIAKAQRPPTASPCRT